MLGNADALFESAPSSLHCTKEVLRKRYTVVESVTLEPIGARVRRLRLDRGWSQEELARRAGVTASQITRIEAGSRQTVRGETIARYAHAFGVSRSYIFLGIDLP
jgi:ribosome-binding protein aMBF1 (putative translation factor)